MRIQLLCLLVFFQGITSACDVPVFRYALERWERDLYKVFILHRGDLKEADSKLADEVYAQSIGHGGHANIVTYKVDLNDEKQSSDFYSAYKDLKEIEVGDMPEMVLLYPTSTRVFKAVWNGDFNKANVDELLNSKATAELMKGVLQGYSATFLVMESGNKAKDERAIKEVNEAMELLRNELEMPEGVVQTDGSVTGGKLTPYEAAAIDPSNVLKSGIPLKIDFHMVRMPNNEANNIFRTILSRTFKDESKEPEPKLFAFFGRGRLLGPMVGDEIIVKHLKQLSHYLCGACSCQVKSQNPGIDFLTNLNWGSFIAGSEVVVDKELPPLIGLIDVEDIKEKAEQSKLDEPQEKVTQEEVVADNSTIKTSAFITVLLLFALVIGGSLIIRKK
ncbi:hypothetical protein LNTAR_12251 [Lentisphaera araneosa HTCC2155]|uniref:Uncharacterized protein n=1 Tax=Lentisphaera araneosa HTCC2155 TaxID=313628 RepID=A6DJQ1_9BACT|nr:hypothetical protein [Lentisphaera araneosa]EDM28125.1 hypothetical protein LNTAR_12251 [Lentisphaera araneosa HTCC2155]